MRVSLPADPGTLDFDGVRRRLRLIAVRRLGERETTNVTSASGQSSVGGHHKASKGAWATVYLLIAGFVVGTFALTTSNLVLWIITGVLLVLGGVCALASRIMEQAY